MGDQQEKPILQLLNLSHPLQSYALLHYLHHILINPNTLGSIMIALPHEMAVAEDLVLPDFSVALKSLERKAGSL